jgi:G protein-coupled receptor 157
MDLMMDEDQNATSVFIDKHISVRIVVGLTCVLSMLGALSVILSYCCIRSLQSQGRLILLNLAVMDFGVGLFNLTGAIINFDEYYFNTTNGSSMINPGNPVEGLCKTQAFLAHFCTGSSVLWTSSLAIYMYIIVFHNHDRNIKFFLWICSIICYGFPLMLTTWLIFTDRLGHSPYTEAAWCGLIINNDTQPYGFPDLFAAIIGYDIWIYTTVALCSGIYVALFMYMHFMVS